MLKTSSIIPLAVDEEVRRNKLVQDAKKSIEPERQQVQEDYIQKKAFELAGPDTSANELAKIEAAIRLATEQKFLTEDVILYLDDHVPTTVGTILADKQKYHGASLSDPLEPDNTRGKAKLFLTGTRPIVHSFLHGGRVFQLRSQTRSIQLGAGRFHEITKEMADGLAAEPDLYCTDIGPVLVDINHAGIPRIQEANVETLTARVAATTRFYVVGKDKDGNIKELDKDPPHRPLQNLAKRKDKIGFKPLNGIVSAPTLRLDGTVIQTPGYDQDTGLLYMTDEPPPQIPLHPSDAQLAAAQRLLMGAFAKFDFASDLDKSIMLTALLTATIRRILPTAPGIIHSATTAGSGKTKLAQCIDIMAGGQGATTALPSEKEELRKAVTSSLMEGAPGIIYDNVTGLLRSDYLCAVLSSPTHSDRILGASRTVTVSTNAMFQFTGNNLDPAGDLSRRTLKIYLDPKCESPWKRKFDFDPVEVVRRDRIKLTVAALTLLRGYIAAGRPQVVKSHTGSFEQWSKLVRQCVIWLDLPDPEGAMHDNHEADPDTEALRRILIAWHSIFDTQRVSNADIGKHLNAGHSELISAFQDAIPNGISATKIAHWLKYRRGRVVGGYRIENYKAGNERGWYLQEMEE